MGKITFDTFQYACKYMHPGCDEDRRVQLTCRRPDNIPVGHSWGTCSEATCPYFPKEATNVTIYSESGEVIATADKMTYITKAR